MAFRKFYITLLASVPIILFTLHACAKKTLSIYIQRLDEEALFLIGTKKRWSDLDLYGRQVEHTFFRQTYAVLEERHRLVSSIRSAGLGAVGYAIIVSPKVLTELILGRECEADYKSRRGIDIINTGLEEWKDGKDEGIWGYEAENEQELSSILEGNFSFLGDSGTAVADAERSKNLDDGLDNGAEDRDDAWWRLSHGRMRPGDSYNHQAYKWMRREWSGYLTRRETIGRRYRDMMEEIGRGRSET